MIKASYTVVCLCTKAPDSLFVSHCKACAKVPSTHFRLDESQPQSLKNHLTAISYRPLHHHPSSCKSKVPPTPLTTPTTFTSPMGSYEHPNRPKCAGSPTRMANCWAQLVCSTHGCIEERCCVEWASKKACAELCATILEHLVIRFIFT